MAGAQVIEEPANWGELADLLADMWGLEVNPHPSGGNGAINALNLIGIGKDSYNAIMEIEEEDLFPIEGDGYDPDNWPPEEELTGEFMCKLKMVVWAAAYAGSIAYYNTPASDNTVEFLTQEEEDAAKEIAEQAVTDLINLARRDGTCETGNETLCQYCPDPAVPLSCFWAPCK